jgi:hypothetical protein
MDAAGRAMQGGIAERTQSHIFINIHALLCELCVFAVSMFHECVPLTMYKLTGPLAQ